MAVLDKPRVSAKAEPLFISDEKMDELRAIVAHQFEAFGMMYEPNATAEDSQRVMLASGIRPEDNILSRAIIAAREE